MNVMVLKKKVTKSIVALLSVLMLSMIAVSTINTQTAFASGLGGVVDDINNANGTVIGTEPKSKVTTLSREIIDIVTVGVIGIVIVSFIITAGKFAGAGEQAQQKAALKSRLIYHVIALAILASYLGFVKFSFTTLNFFK